jgi:hypothetical protein
MLKAIGFFLRRNGEETRMKSPSRQPDMEAITKGEPVLPVSSIESGFFKRKIITIVKPGKVR